MIPHLSDLHLAVEASVTKGSCWPSKYQGYVTITYNILHFLFTYWWRLPLFMCFSGFFLWFIILHFLPMLPVEGFQHTEVWAVVHEVKILTHDDIMWVISWNVRPYSMPDTSRDRLQELVQWKKSHAHKKNPINSEVFQNGGRRGLNESSNVFHLVPEWSEICVSIHSCYFHLLSLMGRNWLVNIISTRMPFACIHDM